MENVSAREYEAWDKVLIYAFELDKEPSKTFIEAAWRLNPLLVALVVEDIEEIKSLPRKQINNFMKDVIAILFQKGRPYLVRSGYCESLIPRQKEISILKGYKSQILFQGNLVAQVGLQNLKTGWWKLPLIPLSNFVALVVEDIEEIKSLPREQINKFVKDVIAILFQKGRPYLVRSGYCESLIPRQKEISILKGYKSQILFQGNLVAQERLQILKTGWWKLPLIPLSNFVMMGLLENSDMPEQKKKELIEMPSGTEEVKSLKVLIDHNYIVKADFVDKLPHWIKSARVRQAAFLIMLDLASKADFLDKIEIWIKQATIVDVKNIIDFDFTSAKELKNKYLSRIRAINDPKNLKALYQLGFIKEPPNKFLNMLFFSINLSSVMVMPFIFIPFYKLLSKFHSAEKELNESIMRTVLEAAIPLLHLDIIDKEDVAYRIPDWIKIATPNEARLLIELGLANKEHFQNKIDEWIKGSTIAEAKWLIKIGLTNREYFYDRLDNWIEEATFDEAMSLIEQGLVSNEVFADKIAIWIKEATPAEKKRLIEKGLARKEAFILGISKKSCLKFGCF